VWDIGSEAGSRCVRGETWNVREREGCSLDAAPLAKLAEEGTCDRREKSRARLCGVGYGVDCSVGCATG